MKEVYCKASTRSECGLNNKNKEDGFPRDT